MAGIFSESCSHKNWCIKNCALISAYLMHLFLTFLIFFCRCIQIRNLHKVYATKKGNCCAVNSLRLTLYENQILALLGEHLQFWFLFLQSFFSLSFFPFSVLDVCKNCQSIKMIAWWRLCLKYYWGCASCSLLCVSHIFFELLWRPQWGW